MTLSNATSEGQYQPAEDCSSKKLASYQTVLYLGRGNQDILEL